MSISCSDRGKEKQVDIKRGEEMEKPKLTDRGEEITPEEWNEAIECLIQKYPEEIFVEVWEAMKNEGDSWSGKRHLSLGMDVRNTLRSSGFQWGSIALDHYWMIWLRMRQKRLYLKKEKNREADKEKKGTVPFFRPLFSKEF